MVKKGLKKGGEKKGYEKSMRVKGIYFSGGGEFESTIYQKGGIERGYKRGLCL